VQNSIITEGCILNGATIKNSVIGIRSRVEHGSQLEGVLMMGADYYQTLETMQADIGAGIPRVGVGQNCFIRKAIIDKNARIGSGVRILNEANRQHHDGEGYFIREGIVVVPKNGTIADGTVI
jgi:glucose-1-phosphate adenylyltransferase